MSKVNEPVEQVQQSAHVEQEQVRTPAEKDKKKIVEPINKARRSLLNTPWLLLAAPLAGVCIWLANNTWVITNNLDKPYLLLAGPATVGSVLALWLVINFFRVIASWCQVTWKAVTAWARKDGSLFWIVTIVFLTVSVLESGSFFDYILKDHDMYGLLGYAVAFGFDLISVMSMRARQKAVRLHDKKGERINQRGVWMSALASTFANAFTALQQYTLPTGTLIPTPMQYAAPVVGAIFPLFMIFLSFAGDYIADQAQVSLDPEEFKKQQEVRVKLIEIRRDALAREVALEKEMGELTGATTKEKKAIRVPAWSFLGLTVYQKQQVPAMPEMTEIVNLQKIVEELRVDIHRQQEETVLPGASLQTPAQNVSIPTSTKNSVVVDDVIDEKRQPVDELFVDSLLDGDDDTFDDNGDDMYVSTQLSSVVDTGERETVNWQATIQKKPQPRITVKLPEVHGTRAKKERITDNLAPTTKKTSTRKVTAVDAKERIRRLLKKQPDMEPTEIAAKVGVSRQYAHKVKTQIIAEKTA